MKTAMLLFGGAVGLSVVSMVTSTLLHVTGRGELDGIFQGVCQLAMMALFIGLLYLVLSTMWSMFGISVNPDIFGDVLREDIFGDHFK